MKMFLGLKRVTKCSSETKFLTIGVFTQVFVLLLLILMTDIIKPASYDLIPIEHLEGVDSLPSYKISKSQSIK